VGKKRRKKNVAIERNDDEFKANGQSSRRKKEMGRVAYFEKLKKRGERMIGNRQGSHRRQEEQGREKGTRE